MPNAFAYVILFSYPLIVIIMFRRMPVPKALIWSIMCGYLFLPEKTFIDLPMLPPFDKVLLPSLAAAVMCWFTPPPLQPRDQRATGGARSSASRVTNIRQKSSVANLCLFVLFVTPIGIALTNKDLVIAGPIVINGIRTYDIFAMMLNTGVMLLPFLLARAHLTTRESHLMLLRAFVISGLVCSVLILIEIRLSPQLNRWIYGFHPHLFSQHIRDGGFRPMLFIEHGLRVGLFILCAVMAAAILYKSASTGAMTASAQTHRSRGQNRQSSQMPIYVFVWLLVILYLSKVLGAFSLALVFSPIIFFIPARQWRIFAAVLALIVLVYPMMRSSNLVPVDKIHELALSISEERAHSLQYRFDNEDILLTRASERPLLGWGGWGRSRVYDPDTGKDISVTDGTWVITFGVSGWIGYLAKFGLLTLPIFALFFVRGPLAMSIATQGLCLILTANLIDLIPNSGLTPLTWMLAGALLGRYEHRADTVPVAAPKKRNSRRARTDAVAPYSRAG